MDIPPEICLELLVAADFLGLDSMLLPCPTQEADFLSLLGADRCLQRTLKAELRGQPPCFTEGISARQLLMTSTYGAWL